MLCISAQYFKHMKMAAVLKGKKFDASFLFDYSQNIINTDYFG